MSVFCIFLLTANKTCFTIIKLQPTALFNLLLKNNVDIKNKAMVLQHRGFVLTGKG